MVNGRAGKGTKIFDRESAERLVEELNREYPQIHHVNGGAWERRRGTSAGRWVGRGCIAANGTRGSAVRTDA